jgi:hypothetical protein
MVGLYDILKKGFFFQFVLIKPLANNVFAIIWFQ